MNAFIGASTLSVPALAGAAAMTFMAAYVRGLTGFGMAIILVPLLGMIIKPEQAVILAIFLQFMIGPVGIGKSLRHCEKPSTFIIAAGAVAMTPVGLWLLSITSHDTARLVIAAIAIGAFVIVIVPKRTHGRPGIMMTVATGLAAGVLTGFAAMPGPPVVPYYLQNTVTPQIARSSMLVIFFATAITGTTLSVVGGFATVALGVIALILLVPMLIGNWLGGMAFGKVSPILWRSGVALLLGMAGLSAVWRAIN